VPICFSILFDRSPHEGETPGCDQRYSRLPTIREILATVDLQPMLSENISKALEYLRRDIAAQQDAEHLREFVVEINLILDLVEQQLSDIEKKQRDS